MSISAERLREIVAELSARPGHEKVRALVYALLVDALGADSASIDFERPLPEVRGRVDALLGHTVFEFKRNLRTERAAAEEELARYLPERERATGARFVGVATDGAEFVAYQMRHGQLAALKSFTTPKDDPRALLVWLDSVVTVQPDLTPDPETVTAHLGRDSVAYDIARARLADAWSEVKEHPDVRLKRQLWADLLEHVYGSKVGDDELFFQHTYLTIVAKAMATLTLGAALPGPADLLGGRPFVDAGIQGAVESDFFDWVLECAAANELIGRIARQVARFRLTEVRTDVLKGLYESLVDPRQRHDLGEYYTPDWLAERICDRAMDRPLDQRVLDPACGSGTFLFHAVRRFLAAADAAGLSNDDALARCCDCVLGVDIHPVAVLIARVTYLLALGERLSRPRRPISIPVYLGDSLQWNTRGFLAERDVLVEVPDGPLLEFPGPVACQPAVFDAVIKAMLDLSAREASVNDFVGWLRREHPVDQRSESVLVGTYQALLQLHRDGRDHVWGYVTRNLSRPVWLSSNEQRVDVVVGNPPWLSYRYMSPSMQKRFRDECQRRGVWAGGKVATHQDLSAYFFARCVELYLRDDGTIAFVMPYAALNRKQFEGFRRGWFGGPDEVFATVRFTDAWAFDEGVQPLFPVPSCVLFARRRETGPLPSRILAATGTLPRRDATLEEAADALEWREVPWPGAPALEAGSAYRAAFRQGATMVPRMLCCVQLAQVGRLGMNREAPLVESRRTPQEKEPWKSLPPLRATVEARFLRPLYLGESVAPFRLLDPVLAVVPWDEESGRVLDARAALRSGYLHLAGWLEQAERLWRAHGRSDMSLVERWDYHRELSAQFPTAPVRVLYAASGTLPAAAVLRNGPAVVEHKLYWAAVEKDEARYLVAILNSEAARSRIAHLQSRGQWGARDFDKLMFELPIPKFDADHPLHHDLAEAARQAEAVAAKVALPAAIHFVRARALI
ncbi:MAG TPA: N-6 DNA methylase, partial [Candidatus Tectomicrobia bacterium]|nr:N-6 DNA methylase [Candidatus Tectomicrobia bacterium]